MSPHRFRTLALALLCATSALPLSAQQAPGVAPPLTLSDAIQRALENSGRARGADAALAAAQHSANAFSARLLPKLSLAGTVPSYNHSIIEVIQPDGTSLFRSQNLTNAALTATVSQPLPFTGGDLFISSSLSRLSVSGPQENLSWQSTPVLIGLRQPLFRPNELGWDRREQAYVSESARRGFLEAREDIALEATTRFFAIHSAEATLANAVANVAVNDSLYRLNTGRYDIGTIGENDLLQSELALLRARADVDAAKLALDRARAELRLALGMAPGAPVDIVIPESVPDFDVDPELAVAAALESRAAMSDLELKRVRAERQVREARLENGFGATLQLSYGFNAAASDMSAAYRDLLEAQRLSVSVEAPLWQWGAGREQVRAAEAEREGVQAAAELAEQQTALEARYAALALPQARRNLALAAKADTVAQKRFDVAYNRYKIGRISVDNLYRAQTEKDQARVSYVAALSSFWQAYYRLRRLTLYDFERGEPIE